MYVIIDWTKIAPLFSNLTQMPHLRQVCRLCGCHIVTICCPPQASVGDFFFDWFKFNQVRIVIDCGCGLIYVAELVVTPSSILFLFLWNAKFDAQRCSSAECVQQSCGPYDKAMRQFEAYCNIAQCLVIVSGSLHGISWLQNDVTRSLQTDVVLTTRVD